MLCCFHFVWVGFEGSSPTCACFHLVSLVPAVFFSLFLEVVREKRGRKGR